MHFIALWKGQCFSDKSANSLSKRIVPALDVGGFTGSLTNHLMFARVDHIFVCLPQVTKRMTTTVLFGYKVPECSATLYSPVADEVGHNLSCSAAQGNPNPSFKALCIYKWPQFIQLKNIRFFRRKKRLYDVWEGFGFFLIHRRAVSWLIPKVRANPRDEERSWAARTTCSLNSSLFRTVTNTPPKPQSRHLYLGFPEPLLPFFTICVEPHLWQVLCSVTMTIFLAKINQLTHKMTLPEIWNQPRSRKWQRGGNLFATCHRWRKCAIPNIN